MNKNKKPAMTGTKQVGHKSGGTKRSRKRQLADGRRRARERQSDTGARTVVRPRRRVAAAASAGAGTGVFVACACTRNWRIRHGERTERVAYHDSHDHRSAIKKKKIRGYKRPEGGRGIHHPPRVGKRM